MIAHIKFHGMIDLFRFFGVNYYNFRIIYILTRNKTIIFATDILKLYFIMYYIQFLGF